MTTSSSQNKAAQTNPYLVSGAAGKVGSLAVQLAKNAGRAGGRVDAFSDAYGSGYTELALKLGVRPERLNTVIDEGAEKHGAKAEGNMNAASAEVLAELAEMVSKGGAVGKVYPPSEGRLPGTLAAPRPWQDRAGALTPGLE